MYLSYDVLGMLGCIVLIIFVIMSFKLVHAQASEGMLDLLLRKLGEQKCHDILDDLKEDITATRFYTCCCITISVWKELFPLPPNSIL